MITLEILGTGPLAVVQDLGRAGLAHLGVGRSGAADRRSHTLANRLVANPDDRATVEVTFGGFSARVRGGDVDIAVTGADTNPAVNGKVFGTNSIRHVRDGQVISLGTPRAGLRSYLAVRGGFCVQPVLGSRSYDMMSAIGPSPLHAGRPAAGRRAHQRLSRTRPGPGRGDLRANGGTSGAARAARRLVRRSRRVGTHDLDGLRSQRPGRNAAGGPPAAVPLPRPAAAQRGHHPRRDSGAAQRVTGHPGSRSPGHRRLPGRGRGRRRGHRQDRPGAARPACAAALGTAALSVCASERADLAREV